MASQTRLRKPIRLHINGGTIPSLTVKARSSRPALCSFDELPEWHQDNHFILHGYRPVSNSVRSSWKSWSYLHNETINIYSHLITGIFFLVAEGLISQYFSVHYPESTYVDQTVFAFFLLTVIICFGMSVTYHTVMNHSKTLSHLWLRLDFLGIAIHTFGNFVSGIYVVFYCEPTLRKVYWSMVWRALSICKLRLTGVWQDTCAWIRNCISHSSPQIPR